MELREKIARIIEMHVCEVGTDGLDDGEIVGAETAADAILELPEIKEALESREPDPSPLTNEQYRAALDTINLDHSITTRPSGD